MKDGGEAGIVFLLERKGSIRYPERRKSQNEGKMEKAGQNFCGFDLRGRPLVSGR